MCVPVVAALSTLGAEGKRPEKLLITAYVVGAKQLYIAVKAGFARELAVLRPLSTRCARYASSAPSGPHSLVWPRLTRWPAHEDRP